MDHRGDYLETCVTPWSGAPGSGIDATYRLRHCWRCTARAHWRIAIAPTHSGATSHHVRSNEINAMSAARVGIEKKIVSTDPRAPGGRFFLIEYPHCGQVLAAVDVWPEHSGQAISGTALPLQSLRIHILTASPVCRQRNAGA